MKKKCGFTLVELLAVFVILAIILTIAVPNLFNVLKKAREDLYERQKDLIEDTTSKYVLIKEEILSTIPNNGDSIYITVGHLMEEDLLDRNLKDPRTNENIIENNKILITHLGNNQYEYEYIGEGEWSEWSTDEPTGSNIEIETATFYNYQEAITYYGEWSEWQDVADDDRVQPVVEVVGIDTYNRTVYRYQDQEWIWYNQTEESECSAVTPNGTGWTRGSICDTETFSCTSTSPGVDWVQGEPCDYDSLCSVVSPGTGWIKGTSCGKETSTCRSSSPGSDWSQSNSCSWNQSSTTCATDGTGSACDWTSESQCASSTPSGTGWSKGSACDSTSTTSCQYSSPGTGYVKGSSCGTETSSCTSSSPGSEWSTSTVCTRQHSMTSSCQSSAPNSWWTAGTICTRDYIREYSRLGSCYTGDQMIYEEGGYAYCEELRTCLSSSPGTDWYGSNVCTRRWNWSGCHSDGTGAICTRQYTRPKYSWTKTTDTKWTYTRQVATHWYKTTTSCSSTGTGTACKWYYTRSEYTYTTPTAWTYTRSKYTYTRTINDYTIDYSFSAPTGYPIKDESQTRYTTWTDWVDIEPTVYPYRTIESKDQFRTRDVLRDWSGNKLANYVSEQELTTLLNMSLPEIDASSNLRTTTATVYRYRIRVY